MSLKLLIAVSTFLLIAAYSSAQTQRIVLLEEATNASCSPCAAYNPILQKFYSSHFGGVISVRYHAWWPGINDPMYVSAAANCRTRINYYGINYVPFYLMDGEPMGSPSDYDAMVAKMEERLKVPAPVKINIDSKITEDSVLASVQIIGLKKVEAKELYLRVAITQRMVSYQTAPGSNGEKDFPEVLRKMLPDAVGTAIDSISESDTLHFTFSTAVNDDWEFGDLAVVAWLQSDVTKEVIQANIDFPTFIVQAENESFSFAEANSTKKLTYSIYNRNNTPIQVQLKIKDLKIPSNWNYWIETEDHQDWHNPLVIQAGDTLHFDVTIQCGEFGAFSAQIFTENLDDPDFYGYGYGYGFSNYLTVVVPENVDLLFVDDDGGANYEDNFLKLFDRLKIKYVCLTEDNALNLQKQFDLNNYKLIIWNVSWAFPAFTAEDIDVLTQYLDRGGALAVFGQDVCWDIFDTQGNSHFQKAMDFFQNYFDLSYLNDDSKGTGIAGVNGDPIGEGLSSNLSRTYGFANFFPEEIISNKGKSKVVFKYNNGKFAALRHDAGAYKTVYFGFGLEQIEQQSARDSVLIRLLKWTANITNIDGQIIKTPDTFFTLNNYPNPFNNSTKIHFNLPGSAQVHLRIYNSRGQIITQWQKTFAAGRHVLIWNGTNQAGEIVSTGMYFIVLTTKSNTLIKKAILLR